MSFAFMPLALFLPFLVGCVSAASPEVEPAQGDPRQGDPRQGEARTAPKTGEIRVTINGLRNLDGQVLVSLFANSKGFPDNGELAAKRSAHKIDGDQIEVSFKEVAAGTYAVAVLHDEDMNFKMKTGFFGIPQEGYGVSNNAKGNFGPPKHGDAKFKVTEQRVELTIKMIYH